MNDQKLIGVDLGGTTVKFAILTQGGEIQQRWSIDTNILDEGSHILPDIVTSINEHLDLYKMTPADFVGIGMGSPGSVDSEAGTIIGAYNLNWKTLQQARKVIESGTGVGGGIIANGELLHGVAGSGGELGHVTVDPVNGYLCTCGKRGCLETVASATGVVRVARDMAEEFAGDSKLKETLDDGDEISSKIVFDLAKEGDRLALMIVDRVSFYLGLALANVGNLLNPKFIVIGGGVSAAGEFLLTRVDKYFKENTFPNVRETTSLRLATLGNTAGVIGAASLALK